MKINGLKRIADNSGLTLERVERKIQRQYFFHGISHFYFLFRNLVYRKWPMPR